MTILDVRGPRETNNGQVWDIITDMEPAAVTALGVALAEKWIAFAMGRQSLGGKILMHPTGRYASSIKFKQMGVAHVAVIANEKMAPEAGILERGHRSIDLKDYPSQMGHAIPMHRGAQRGTSSAGYPYQGAGYGSPILNTSASARRKNIWAVPKAQGVTGYGMVGKRGWVIPPMPAYSPAAHLVDLIRSNTL